MLFVVFCTIPEKIFFIQKHTFLLFFLMKKVSKKIKTLEGIAAVAAPLQKTGPITTRRDGRPHPVFCNIFCLASGFLRGRVYELK